MIWLTWRQHRLEAVAAALLLVPFLILVAGLIAAAQPLLAQVRANCPAGDACALALQRYDGQFGFLRQILHVSFLALPILPGLFVGAPLLAREFEQGTDQMIWSQGVTRRRWLLVKLGILGTATIALAGVLGAISQQWAAAEPTLSYSQWFEFDQQVPVYVAYAFFSFAFGVAAGAVISKTVPAMAAVLVGFVGARMVIELLVRRNYLPPLDRDVTTSLFNQGDAWLLGDQRHVDLQGNVISDDRFAHVASACGSVQPDQFGNCLREQGIVVLQSYQPADRFLLFQGIETAIFVVAALGLIGMAVWLVRRRS